MDVGIVSWPWIFILFLMLLIYNGVIGYMPPIEELEDPHDKLASLVYASDGTTELGLVLVSAPETGSIPITTVFRPM